MVKNCQGKERLQENRAKSRVSELRNISTGHYDKWDTRLVAAELSIASDRRSGARTRIVGFLVQSAVIGVPTAPTHTVCARDPSVCSIFDSDKPASP